MNFDDYQAASRRTMNAANQTEREQYSNAALGIAGEAGEVADLIKKHLYHGHALYGAELAEELGDLLFYMHWLSHLSGFTLAEIAAGNVRKLAARYPDGFDPERSRSRE